MIKKLAFMGIFAVLLNLACSDKPVVPPTGTLNVYLQDGMADYDSVFVVIDSIYTDDPWDDADPTRRMILHAGPDTIDVAALRNGGHQLLAQVELQSMEIGGLDLMFSADGRIVVDGVSYPLNLPEYNSPVHALALGAINVSIDRETNALIDFNLYESINYDQASESYGLMPSIRLIDSDSSGALTGQTSPVANIFLFYHDSTDTLSFTRSEGDSLFFGFYGLEPGFYDLLCRPIGSDTLNYDDLLNVNIAVLAGSDFDMMTLYLPEL